MTDENEGKEIKDLSENVSDRDMKDDGNEKIMQDLKGVIKEEDMKDLDSVKVKSIVMSQPDPKTMTDNGREKDQQRKTDDERENDLKIMFDLSSQIAGGKRGAVPLDRVQSWFRKATNISEVEVGSAYRNTVQDQIGITFPELKEMIALLAQEKELNPNDIIEKLSCACTPQPGECIDYERKIGRDYF
ncbi:hypothetical protein HNY73_019848 [Argiope bruennichi]|uniref:Uncharacterized protein n=1 Tax=Argiope bruennichi TaxID=94029 RepID=A0A8T0E4W9_ARGBR|nr:hypothetical protein HNY73_019848 [Argiope bruennichi]